MTTLFDKEPDLFGVDEVHAGAGWSNSVPQDWVQSIPDWAGTHLQDVPPAGSSYSGDSPPGRSDSADSVKRGAPAAGSNGVDAVDVPVGGSGCVELADALAQVTVLCRGARVSGARLEEVSGLLTAIKEAGRYLDGIKLSSIARIDELQRRQAEASTDGRRPPLPGKERTLADTLTSGGMQSQAQTGREMKQARAFSAYPFFGEAIEKGRLSDAYLDVLTSVIGPRLKDRAHQDEAALLAIALNEPVEHFKKGVRSWAVTQRPVRAEVDAKKEAAQESFSVFPDGNGYRLSGWLAGMNGTALKQALRDIVGVPAQDDYRHPKQRDAEALIGLVLGAVGSFTERDMTAGRGRVAGAGFSSGRTGNPGVGGNAGGCGVGASVSPSNGTIARHEILVHVPFSTLVQTEKAIERGCKELDRVADNGPGSRTDNGMKSFSSSGLRADARPLGGTESQAGSGSMSSEGSLDGEDSRFVVGAISSEEHLSDLESGPCWTTGAGLGRCGKCLDRRAQEEVDLGGVLSIIRAGMNSDMLEGFAPATLPDGSPLAPSQLAQLMCDSNMTRLVVNARGEPLDVSRRQRLFSQRQAKAVVGRDRHCQYPGCTRGPEQGEIHHAQEWERGGATVIDNAVLLCFAHHAVIHREQITIAHHLGGFVFTSKDGTRIGTSLNRTLAS